MPTSSAAASFTWHAYVDGMVDAAGSTANCAHPGPEEVEAVVPGGYVARQNPFVYFHSLLDLGDCSTNDLPLDRADRGPAQSREDAELLLHRADALQFGCDRPVPGGGTEGPASADAFLLAWVPKILASPAYKADGLLIVNFAAANPPIAVPEGTPAPSPRSAARGRPPALALPDPGLHRRFPVQPLLDPPLQRGPLRPGPTWPSGRGQNEVLRSQPVEGKRR